MLHFLSSHLRDSQTSYFEHLKFAIYAAVLLVYAATASLIHAVFPFLFKGTAAFIVIKLYKQRLEHHPNQMYKEWVNKTE